MTTYAEVATAWAAYNAAAAKYGRPQMAWEQVTVRCGVSQAAFIAHLSAVRQAQTPPALSPQAEAMAAAALCYLEEGIAGVAASSDNGADRSKAAEQPQQESETGPGNGADHEAAAQQQQETEEAQRADHGNESGAEAGENRLGEEAGENRLGEEREGLGEGANFDDLAAMVKELEEGDRHGARDIIRAAARLGSMDADIDEDAEGLLVDIKEQTKISLGELRPMLRRARKKAAEEAAIAMANRIGQAAAAQKEQEAAEAAALCELRAERVANLAKDTNLLSRVVAAVHRLGVVEEDVAIKATYLTATSRLLSKRVISLLRQGTAASGKNFLFEQVLVLIPQESVVRITGSSAKCLVYFGGDEDPNYLANMIVYIPEASALLAADGKEHEMAGMMRSLISENRIDYPMVTLRPDGQSPITIRIIKNGPIAALITSARDNVEPEMKTRLAFADADESIEQNSRVMTAHFDAAAALNGLTDAEKAEIDLLVEFQRWLRDGGPYDAVVPFAPQIRAAFSKTPRAVRIRRDIGTLIAGVAASAVMHKARRDTDEKGRIVATMDDYGHAIDAFGPGVATFHNPQQSAGVVALVRVLEKLAEKEKAACAAAQIGFDDKLGASAPRRILAKELGLASQKTVSSRLEAACASDVIVCTNEGAGTGVVRRYRVLIKSAVLEKAREGGGSNSVFPSRASVKQMIDDDVAFKAALEVIRQELAQEPGGSGDSPKDPEYFDPESPGDYEAPP